MTSTRRSAKRRPRNQWLIRLILGFFLITIFFFGFPSSYSQISLSSDWNRHDQTAEGADVAAWESSKVKEAWIKSARTRGATKDLAYVYSRLGYRMHFDGALLYAQPIRFMHKKSPGEICTVQDYVRHPTYLCEEGQRHLVACHLAIYDAHFRESGWKTLNINESMPIYCNDVLAIGVSGRSKNELLLTVQYFPVDGMMAGSIHKIGAGWRRMTILLNLSRLANGQVVIEQDDSCLGNPNEIVTIPDARAKLRKCQQYVR